MLFYVRKALIEECKMLTFDDFYSKYTVLDVCKLMDLPIAKPETIYKHLCKALVRDVSNWIKLDSCTSSKGNQVKYYSEVEQAYIKLQFYYDSQFWHDELVEVIASELFYNKFDIPVIEQFPVLTNEGWGTYSKDFTNGKTFISFATLCEKYFGDIIQIPYAERFVRIRDIINKCCNLDVTDYLLVMALTDTIVLNEDRHYNNFGVLYKDDIYTISPLFDYGLGLFEHDSSYTASKYNNNLEVALRKVKSKPFLTNHFKTLKSLCDLGYADKLQYYLKSIVIPDSVYTPSSLSDVYLKTVLERVRSIVCIK